MPSRPGPSFDSLVFGALLGSVVVLVPVRAPAVPDLYELQGGTTHFEPAAPLEADLGLEITDPEMTFYRDGDGNEYRAQVRGSPMFCRTSPDGEWLYTPNAVVTQVNNWSLSGMIDDRLWVWMPYFDAQTFLITGGHCGVDVVPENLPTQASLERPLAWDGPGVNFQFTPIRPDAIRLFGRDGKVCGGDDAAIWCFDPADATIDEIIELPVWLDAYDVGAQIPDGEATFDRLYPLINSTPGPRKSPTIWEMLSYLQVPSGDLYVLIRGSVIPGEQTSIAAEWLVRVNDPDDVEVLTPPLPSVRSGFELPGGPRNTSLFGAPTEMHYDAEWDALWIGPIPGAVPTGRISSFPVDEPEIPEGNLGYRVIPLSEPGLGLLDLSRAWAVEGVCDHVQSQCLVGATAARHQLGDELLLFRLYEPGAWWFDRTLELDRDALDLDGDGLPNGEERSAGTSQWLADTDGDGADDGIELLLGDDPTAPDGSYGTTPVSLFPSPLLAFRIAREELAGPDPVAIPLTLEPSLNLNAPLCRLDRPFAEGGTRWICRDLAGHTVADLDATHERGVLAFNPPVMSVDGSLLAVHTFDGVDAVDLATGTREQWVSADVLYPLVEDVVASDELGFMGAMYAYPVDRNTMWMFTQFDPRDGEIDSVRILQVDREGNARVVLDTFYDPCERELGNCDPSPTGAFTLSQVPTGFALGYHRESGRLMFGWGGNWESYLVGLSPDGPPLVLQRARALTGWDRAELRTREELDWQGIFPSRFLPLADGGYFTGMRPLGPRFEPVPLTRWSELFPSQRSGSPFAVQTQWPFVNLGDAIIDTAGVEYIHGEQRVRPGDTLLLGWGYRPLYRYEEGYMLWSIGPRGGANPLWDTPLEDLEGPTGMDLADDGTLCIADRSAQKLFELEPDPDTRVPRDPVGVAEGDQFVDCLYQADGTMIVLLEEPPRVARLEEGGTLTPLETLEGLEYAADLIEGPDGYEVLRLGSAADSVKGYTYLADGSRWDFQNGQSNDENGDPIVISETSLARVVQRPDGNLVLVFATMDTRPFPADESRLTAGPVIVYPNGEAFPIALFAWGQPGPFQTLAQVPGGEAVDPWTGEPGASCWDDPVACEAGDGDADADADGDGDGDAGGDGGADEDGGCGCRTVGGDRSGWVGLLAGVVALARRRRRR